MINVSLSLNDFILSLYPTLSFLFLWLVLEELLYWLFILWMVVIVPIFLLLVPTTHIEVRWYYVIFLGISFFILFLYLPSFLGRFFNFVPPLNRTFISSLWIMYDLCMYVCGGYSIFSWYLRLMMTFYDTWKPSTYSYMRESQFSLLSWHIYHMAWQK